MCCSTATYSNEGNDFCKYSDDPIEVNKENPRHLLVLSGSTNLLTFCNLQVGETYSISGISESNPNCEFQFGFSDSQFIVNPSEKDAGIAAPKKHFEFVAISECMDVMATALECVNDTKNYYSLIVSIHSFSEVKDDDSFNTFLPNIEVDPSLTAEELISDVFIGGDCFDVSNVQAIGNGNGLGLFSVGASSVGMDKGVILSSGNAVSAPGPCGGNASTANGGPSDDDLAALAGINVNDAAGIEFDFVPTIDQLTFNYVFASEEYCEWVGQYNDAFGFFISGPGINGPFSNNAENIALIPGTTTNVAINNVNHNTNTQYFNPNANNCGGFTNCNDIKYDGYTTIFTAEVYNLEPCETYHIKLVVGDANDQIFDTAVFLEAGSFAAGGEFTAQGVVPNTTGNVAIEQCQDGQFVFTRNALDLSLPLTVNFVISGTATSGDDYVPFQTSITFQPGQSLYFLDVDILPDNITEGTETIIITMDSDACACSGQTAELIIEDYIELEVEDGEFDVCGIETTTIDAIIIGGAPNFTYLWSTNQTSSSINVSPSTTSTYTVTVTDDCGETAEGSYTVNVEDEPTATLSGDVALCADDQNPSAILTITFTGPGPWDITYNLNGQPQAPITGITDNPYELIVTEIGNYTLTSVENAICPGSVFGGATVTEVDVELAIVPINILCNGDLTGSIDLTVLSGDPAFTYQWDNAPPVEDPGGLAAGPYSVTVTDANGCTETISTELTEPPALTIDLQLGEPINCNGGIDASLDLTVTGGSPNYTYNWNNAPPVEDPDNLPAGTYIVTVTDLNGCTISTSITIDEPELLVIADLSLIQNVSCFGGSDGAVDITVTGGIDPYFYDWGAGGTEEDPNNLSSGNYIVTVTDFNGCSTVGSVFITEPPALVAVAVETQQVNCYNPGGGSVDLAVAGGTPNYTYFWSNNSQAEDPTDLPAGDYTVTVTDANGCTEVASVTVTENTTPPVADAVTQEVLSCTIDSVTIDGSGSSGQGNLSYEWLDENNTVISNDPSTDVGDPGDYTLIVTDQLNGCTAEVITTVDENNDEPVADAQVSGVLTCDVGTVTLDGSNSTGIGTISFEWLDENNAVISDQISTDVGDPGDYTLIVTDIDNGCTTAVSITVDENVASPVADATVSGPLTCAVSTTTLDGGSSSGNGPISYEWFDNLNNSLGVDTTLDVSNPGAYTLIITDTDNGCTSSFDIDVDENTIAPDAVAQAQAILTCDDVDITVAGSGSTGNGTLAYDWQFGGNSISDSVDIDVSDPGIYTLIVTDIDNGCTDQMDVEVFQDIEAPSAVADVSGLITCTSTTVTLDGGGSSGSGTINYNWLDSVGSSVGNGATLDVGTAGTYTLVVTNESNGCTDETSLEVEEDSNFPSADAVADGILTCADGTVQIDGSNSSSNGTTSFNWLDSGGNSMGSDPTLDVTVPDTYTLIITDEDNGCTAQTSVQVDQDIAAPVSDAGQGTTLTCGVTSVSLDGSASSSGNNISYLWQNAGGVPVGNTVMVDVSQTGIYTLIVTNDDNGCTASSTVEVVPDADLPVANAGLGATLTCAINDVDLDGSGSSSGNNIVYEWFDPNSVSLGSNIMINVSAIGTYTLVVTDNDNGCSASSSVEVIEDLVAPVPDAGNDAFITCVDTDATLDASNSVGNNLSYEWTDPSGGSLGGAENITVSDIGIYTLMVTDGVNGCTAETTVEVIPDIDEPVADAGQDGLLTCDIIQVTLDGNNSSGGTLEYEWLDDQGIPISTDPTVNVSTTGMYTLIVTDTENGCTNTATAEVTEDIIPPVAEAGDNSLLTCVVFDVTLDGSNSTGSPNLEFEWQNSSGVQVGNNAAITVSLTDIYTLIVTNTDNGCTASDNVEVNPDYDAPLADAGQDGLLTCAVTQVTLDGSASTGSSNLSFEWLDPISNPISTNVDVDVSIPGIYTLIVTNEDNGCTEMATVEVDEDVDLPLADAGQDNTVSCVDTDAILDGSGSESGSNISYSWEDDMGNEVGTTTVITVSNVGVYTLIVTNDDTGCSSSSTAEVTSTVVLPTADAGLGSTLTCDITEVTLDGSGSDSGNTISYEWLDPSGNTISTTINAVASEPGTYTIIVTDSDNGCVTQATVDIDQDITPPVAFINTGSSTDLDCDITSTVLDGTGSSPANSLDFMWTTADGNIMSGATTPNPEVNAEGTYTLTVTNTLNGCTASTDIFIAQDITPPVAFINDPDELTCVVLETNLDGTGSSANGNFSYSWSNAGGGIVSGDTTLQPTVNLPGIYTLTVLNEDNGCESSANITVNEDITPPNAVAATDEEFDCVTESINLSGEGSSIGPDISYLWSGNGTIDNNTGLAPTIYEPGTYTILVTDNGNGCTNTADVIVDVNGNVPNAAAFEVVDAPCFGEPGSITIADVTGGSPPYLYSVDGGQSFSSSNIFSSLQPGEYEVIIQDAIGCEHEELVTIQPAVELTVNVQTEVVIELGENYQIDALINVDTSEIDQIIWSPTEGLSCTDCLNPKVDTLLHEIQYTVTIINHNGCQSTDQIMLRVDKTREVFIPNAFSPHNNDGQNDRFMIFANNDKIRQVNTFQVYDRWGEQIFLAENFLPNDPTYGWDGKLDDEPLNPAVFVYWAEIEFIDGVKIIYKGDVTLMQ